MEVETKLYSRKRMFIYLFLFLTILNVYLPISVYYVVSRIELSPCLQMDVNMFLSFQNGATETWPSNFYITCNKKYRLIWFYVFCMYSPPTARRFLICGRYCNSLTEGKKCRWQTIVVMYPVTISDRSENLGMF